MQIIKWLNLDSHDSTTFVCFQNAEQRQKINQIFEKVVLNFFYYLY